MKIYHNSRCRKSREALKIIQNHSQKYEIIEYMKDRLSAKEISSILKKLRLDPINLVRENESIWKQNYKGKKLTNTEIINIMQENPKLIQRPIIITDNKAIIGRDIEKIKNLFN